MGGCQGQGRLEVDLVDRRQRVRIALANSGNAFDNQVLAGDGARFVEAAHVHSSSKRDPERFSAEDNCVKG
jgi:hypothetical protein